MGYKLAFENCRAFIWSPFIWIRGKHVRLPVPETKASVTLGRARNIGLSLKKKADVPLIWWLVVSSPRRGVVSLTSRSRTSHVVPPRSETSAAHVYASFSQSWYKKVGYACIYFVLWPSDQVKAVRELTQHLRETTSEVGEQDVGETTVNLLVYIVYFVLFQTTRLGGNWRLPTHQSQHDGVRSRIKADHFQSWTFAEAFNTGASSFYRKLIWFIYWRPLDSRRRARFNLRFFRFKKDTPESFIVLLFIRKGNTAIFPV